MIGHFNGFIKQLERGTRFEYEQPGSLGKAWRDETNMVAREINYSLSQNCWDTFASSRPINVNVTIWTQKEKNGVCIKCHNYFCLGL